MDFWLPLVGGAAAGALISSLFGFIKVSLDRSTEHTQWLRNQKIEVYTNLLRTAHASVSQQHTKFLGAPDLDHKLEDIPDVTNSRLMIVGSQAVRTMAGVHFDSLSRASRAVTAENYEALRPMVKLSEARLEEAIREDLDVIERDALKYTLRLWFFKHLVEPWRDPLRSRWANRKGARP